MRPFLKLQGINKTSVLVDANGITAFASTDSQTIIYLASGQEIIVQDKVDDIVSRINNLMLPQTPRTATVPGILIK